MIRPKGTKNSGINNQSALHTSGVQSYYQHLDDKYGQNNNKYANPNNQNGPQRMILSNILQNINLNSKISNKRKKTNHNQGNSSMRSDYEDIRARSQSRDYSFIKDVYKQPVSNVKTTKGTTGSRKNSTSVNKPRPKPNVNSYYNYSLNVSRHGKY